MTRVRESDGVLLPQYSNFPFCKCTHIKELHRDGGICTAYSRCPCMVYVENVFVVAPVFSSEQPTQPTLPTSLSKPVICQHCGAKLAEATNANDAVSIFDQHWKENHPDAMEVDHASQ